MSEPLPPKPKGRPRLPENAGADKQIQFRVTGRRKGAYVAAARKNHQTLAAWCFEHLDAAARAAGEDPDAGL